MENVKPALIRPCTVIWLLLLLLTVGTYMMSLLGIEGKGLVITVLLFALIKGHLIIDWYMGLRRVSGFWRPMLGLYLVTLGTLITLAFLLPIH